MRKSKNAEMLGAVHTHTHTHTCILNNNKRAGVNTALKAMDKKENQE